MQESQNAPAVPAPPSKEVTTPKKQPIEQDITPGKMASSVVDPLAPEGPIAKRAEKYSAKPSTPKALESAQTPIAAKVVTTLLQLSFALLCLMVYLISDIKATLVACCPTGNAYHDIRKLLYALTSPYLVLIWCQNAESSLRAKLHRWGLIDLHVFWQQLKLGWQSGSVFFLAHESARQPFPIVLRLTYLLRENLSKGTAWSLYFPAGD